MTISMIDEQKLEKIVETIFKAHGFAPKVEEGWVLPTQSIILKKA